MTTECESCSPLLAKWKDCLFYANTSVIRRYIYLFLYSMQRLSQENFLYCWICTSSLVCCLSRQEIQAALELLQAWAAQWMGRVMLSPCFQYILLCFTCLSFNSFLTVVGLTLFVNPSDPDNHSNQPFRLSVVLWKQIVLIHQNEDLKLPSKVSSWNHTGLGLLVPLLRQVAEVCFGHYAGILVCKT